ncbi:putative PAS/PAC sensor protein [Haliangium ochraceum DSM 14365]|uniref:histidine kinase n=1 Tax=Haliangium ochraceum (strain DSM 14365 / JCM 11303 / SMP-2) TaxID=502025 RepID=D0LKP9_HALO1|nr:putative PAS/PAC sensor protein [Haliangium ochraceum DSM 14365]
MSARGEVAQALERGGFTDVGVACAPRPDAAASDDDSAADASDGDEDTSPGATGDDGAPAAGRGAGDAPTLVVVVGDADAPRSARERYPGVPLLAALRLAAADGAEAGASGGASAGTEATAAMRAGADEVVLWPLEIPILATRARRLISTSDTQRRALLLAHLQEAMGDILRLAAIDGDSPESLREALALAAETLDFDRAALIAHAPGSELGYVIAATDEPELGHFAITIAKYPELDKAIATNQAIIIDDVCSDPVTAPVADVLSGKDVRAVAVFPVRWRGEVQGVVQFRRARAGARHLDVERRTFARMFADVVAARLQHGKVLESLKEKTQRVSRTRYEAERRLRTIDALKEHFESTADGVLVLDAEGHILYVNRATEQLTGFARDGLIDAPVGILSGEGDVALLREAVGKVLQDENVGGFDIELRTTSGESVRVSVSTSTVLGKSGAAILNIRDVTEQRLLEHELRQTKDFLERLIDSAGDAIVAADLRGNIIIFNKGAERIFGFSADQVVGRKPVWELYADGVARRVMRMLRSTQCGGVGRIDQIRHEILSQQGERVQVNMTASIVYQEGREVATVAIFSDLRDRIRIEQRLLQAQQKLEITEQQAMAAQIAGTAAHELNQPLTSIQACAEMLKRQSEEGAPYMRYVDSIVDQVERMASLVRRIGHITMFHTKQYMPGTLILDLDKSAPAEDDEGSLAEPGGEDSSDQAAEEFREDNEITLARVEISDLMSENDSAPAVEPLHMPPGDEHPGSEHPGVEHHLVSEDDVTLVQTPEELRRAAERADEDES